MKKKITSLGRSSEQKLLFSAPQKCRVTTEWVWQAFWAMLLLKCFKTVVHGLYSVLSAELTQTFECLPNSSSKRNNRTLRFIHPSSKIIFSLFTYTSRFSEEEKIRSCYELSMVFHDPTHPHHLSLHRAEVTLKHWNSGNSIFFSNKRVWSVWYIDMRNNHQTLNSESNASRRRSAWNCVQICQNCKI